MSGILGGRGSSFLFSACAYICLRLYDVCAYVINEGFTYVRIYLDTVFQNNHVEYSDVDYIVSHVHIEKEKKV